MIHRRPQAVEAIIDQAAYIGQDSPAAAERFLDAVEVTFADLEKTPRLGRSYESEHPRLTDLRVWRVKGFPKYLIFYRPVPDGIEIIHLLHGARDIPKALQDEV